MMKALWILFNFCTHVMAVTIYPPGRFVSVPGGNAAFSCLSTSDVINTVEWLINGTVIEPLELTNVEIRDIGHGVVGLQLFNIPIEFNNSRIQCRVHVQSGRVETSSGPLLILLEGLLGHVQTLEATEMGPAISVFWTPPEQLNGADSLISYCIEILSLTSSEALLDECGLVVTELNYPFPANARCQALSLRITITPVNAIGNGRSRSLFYDSPESSPGVIEVVRRMNTEGIVIHSLIMSAPVCDVELTFRDIKSTNITLGGSDLNITVNSISVMADQLYPNRDYNATCDSSNVRGSNTSRIMLQNRDLEDFTVMTSSNNLVTFALSFNEISDASGAMLSFVFMDNGDPDFSRSVLLPCSTNPFHNVTLHPGSYLVHGYDIERNRLLYPGISNPVVTRVLQVDGDIDGQYLCRTTIDCNIGYFSGNITVKCSSFSSTVTGFEVLAQASKADEVCQLFVQYGDLRSTVTVKVDNGTYRVTVFPFRDDSGILYSCPYTDVVSVLTEAIDPEPGTNHVKIILPVLALLIAVIILITVVMIILKSKLCKHDHVHSANINSKGDDEEEVRDSGNNIFVAPSPAQVPCSEQNYSGEKSAQTFCHDKLEPVLLSNRSTPPNPALQRNFGGEFGYSHSLSDGEPEIWNFHSPMQSPDEDSIMEDTEPTEVYRLGPCQETLHLQNVVDCTIEEQEHDNI